MTMPENNSGKLEKLNILAYEKPDYSGKYETFKAYFNPDQYISNIEVDYNTKRPVGKSGGPAVFNGIKPQQHDITMVFDGTGVSGPKIDVQETIDEMLRIIGYSGKIHRPRYLLLVWGKLKFRCVIQKVSITYKLFNPNGTPLRASVVATFSEHIDDETNALEADNSSPDLTHIRTVTEGDTLPNMAYEIYGDPGMYLELARVNKIKNIRKLTVGQKIIFPPIEK